MAAQRSDLDGAAMRRARAQGATFRQIAAEFGVSTATAFNRTRGTVLEGGHVVAGHGRSEIRNAHSVSMASTDHGKA
jgi:transposase